MICSFVSYNGKDRIFDIPREKYVPTLVHSSQIPMYLHWNWHWRDGEGPLQWNCVVLGKTLVVGPIYVPPKGHAQQVALHLQIYATCCHGKEHLEKLGRRVQRPQNMELTTFTIPFDPPFGFHHIPHALAVSHGGDMLSTFRSAKPSREFFIYHLMCSKEDKAG